MVSLVCGDTLANALTLLNCNGERTLEGASLDWLFENPKLNEFLRSFCKSVEYGRITLVEESQDTIKENNPDVIAKELKKLNLASVRDIEDEVKRRMIEIHMKERAKEEILNQQKLLRSSINSLEKEAANMKSLKSRVETNFKLEQDKCSIAHKELSEILDNLVVALSEFTNESGSHLNESSSLEGQNSSSSTFTNAEPYLSLEEAYLTSLQGYVNKQFKKQIWEAVNNVEQEASSIACDSSDSNPVFNRTSEGLENFLKWKKELCRLKECLKCSKEYLIRAQTVEEALKEQILILEEKLSKNVPEQGLDVWQLKLKTEQAMVNQDELTKQLSTLSNEVLPQKVLKYVNALMNDLITANYDIKLKRQQYFMDKQTSFFQLLLKQQSRLALFHIAVQVDSRQNAKLQQVLKNITEEFRDEAELSLQSYEYMRKLKNQSEIENSHLPSPADLATNILADVIGQNEEKLYVCYKSMRNFAEEFRKNYDDLRKTTNENLYEEDQLINKISFDFNLFDKTLTPIVLDSIDSIDLKQSLNTLEFEVEKLELNLLSVKSLYAEKVKFLDNCERERSKREQLTHKFA